MKDIAELVASLNYVLKSGVKFRDATLLDMELQLLKLRGGAPELPVKSSRINEWCELKKGTR